MLFGMNYSAGCDIMISQLIKAIWMEIFARFGSRFHSRRVITAWMEQVMLVEIVVINLQVNSNLMEMINVVELNVKDYCLAVKMDLHHHRKTVAEDLKMARIEKRAAHLLAARAKRTRKGAIALTDVLIKAVNILVQMICPICHFSTF